MRYKTMMYKFSNGKFILIEESVLQGLENSKNRVEYYEKLLSYTNKSVKRKRIQELLKWWKKQLVKHEEAAEKIKSGKNECFDFDE